MAETSPDELPTLRLSLVEATAASLADYALFIGTEVHHAGLPIPYYRGSVVEGHNLPFVCVPPAVVRTAKIARRPSAVTWLERHLRMTQLFVGLGSEAFAMVLGKPTHARGEGAPRVDELCAFRVPAGHGVLLHEGTWHDFPMALGDAVTVLTMSSGEVVDTLASAIEADELDHGDVLKIDVEKRMGVRLVAPIP
jgi:ureidoglycolate lyase